MSEQPRFPRRTFLAASTAAAAGLGLAGVGCGDATAQLPSSPEDLRRRLDTWRQVRAEFLLESRPTHFDSFLLASHPATVRAAIARHRSALDRDPDGYVRRQQSRLEERMADAASAYLGTRAVELAFTDSTTMGLGLVYGGLRLAPGDEILTTEHDFYATHEAIRLRSLRLQTPTRRIRLYDDPERASVDSIIRAIRGGISQSTRVLALTWVHSSSGVKLPLARVGELLAGINRGRPESRRVLLIVDGVHGLGNQPEDLPALGCDVFVSGCHKWLFGPRGTGIVWISDRAAPLLEPIIPTFDPRAYRAWLQGVLPTDLPKAAALTPGGFHSFEHRWALAEAFMFHRAVGKRRVSDRTRVLATQLKDGLARLPQIRLRTPRSGELSAGLVCFEHRSLTPRNVVDALGRRQIVATLTPYATQYVRLGPGILNSPADVDRALRAIRALRA